jgi:hypothetical protein
LAISNHLCSGKQQTVRPVETHRATDAWDLLAIADGRGARQPMSFAARPMALTEVSG